MLQNKASLIPLSNNAKLEFYDFPGLYGQKGLGESLTTLRMEGEEARHNTVIGGSECRSFSPGGRFKVAKHHNDGEKGGKWMLTSVKHTVTLGGSYLTGVGHSDRIYENEFECQPADTVYRPDFRQRVGVDGIQSAVIVGPEGEEIYTDKYGRVKVQFPWDRRGKKDDKSSCWIRVSQVHAGKGWGMMDLPRIGEEVLVSFLDGNPDRPVIIGRVYNGDNDPPFSLPAEKTRRGNSTKTHKGAHLAFARLVTLETVFDVSLRPFLARAYDLKAICDYELGPDAIIPREAAEAAVAEAARFVAHIADLLGGPPNA